MSRFAFILTIAIIVGCDNPIDIDLSENIDAIVIEGWINDREGYQELHISKTLSFSNEASVPNIDDAQVYVAENEFEYTFHSIGSGIYQSDSIFAGIVGRSYQLVVILSDGDTLQSLSEELMDVPDIDQLDYDYFLRESVEDPSIEIRVYYPIVYARDPLGETNYYKWNVSVNDVPFTDPASITLLEDRFIDGNNFRNDLTNFELEEGDLLKVEVQSLSPFMYDFFRQFRSQVVSQGTSSSGSPSRLTGNIINVSSPQKTVLGFFGATSVKQKETRILRIQ